MIGSILFLNYKHKLEGITSLSLYQKDLLKDKILNNDINRFKET